MVRILVIDSNPDTQRALSGLLKYRTQHTFEMVNSCTEGAQKAMSMRPDLIMINALMFMGNNYVFSRVMQQLDQTSGIPFLLYTSRDVGELTRKQIEASGVAGMVELPITAEELNDEIVKASERSNLASWQRIEKSSASVVHKGKTVQAVQWQSISPEDAKMSRPPKDRPSKPPQGGAPKAEKKASVFRPLADTVQREKRKASEFQTAAFELVKEDQTVKNKKSETFKEQTWDDINPGENVKGPRR